MPVKLANRSKRSDGVRTRTMHWSSSIAIESSLQRLGADYLTNRDSLIVIDFETRTRCLRIRPNMMYSQQQHRRSNGVLRPWRPVPFQSGGGSRMHHILNPRLRYRLRHDSVNFV